jgi:hypothetical protein
VVDCNFSLSKPIPFMSNVSRNSLLKGIASLFLAANCYAGADSSAVSAPEAHDNAPMSTLREVLIYSRPTRAKILINGDYIGTTPLRVDFAVDKFGRAIRDIELRAIAPEPLATEEIRRFPAAGTDGDASRIPHSVDFDLNIHPVLVVR